MDAVKYLKEAFRMCETICDCDNCPMKGIERGFPCELTNDGIWIENLDKCVSIVEEWSSKNPVKTRQSELLKLCPDVVMNDEFGVVDLCPSLFVGKIECENKLCIDCKKEYWLTEIKD